MKTLLTLVALLFVSPALAQNSVTAKAAFYKPLGYCALSSLSAATLVSTCSGGIPAKSSYAIICSETQGIRWRDDGTSPTASVGMPVSAGACISYYGDFTAIQIIQQAASASVDISFYQ